jgi:ABC-2 type transport system permease protein
MGRRSAGQPEATPAVSTPGPRRGGQAAAAASPPDGAGLDARTADRPVRARLALYWLALYRRRRILLALTIGMVAFESLIIVITRTIPPEEMFAGSIRQPPSAFRAFSGSGGAVSLASYPGLVGAGLIHPFWIAMQLTVVGSFGAGAVAADVEAGTIELLMVRPVSRARLLAERTAALVTGSLVVTAAATAAVAAGVAATPRLHETMSLAGVAAAGVLGLGLALCIAGPVLAVSAASRHRGQVVGATIAFGAVGFAINFIAQAWSTVAFLRFLSPFHYYTPADALVSGTVPLGSLTVLLAVFVVGVAAAGWLLARRDLAP